MYVFYPVARLPDWILTVTSAVVDRRDQKEHRTNVRQCDVSQR